MKQLKHPSSGSKWRQQIERFVVVMALLIISGGAHAAGLTELNTFVDLQAKLIHCLHRILIRFTQPLWA